MKYFYSISEMFFLIFLLWLFWNQNQKQWYQTVSEKKKMIIEKIIRRNRVKFSKMQRVMWKQTHLKRFTRLFFPFYYCTFLSLFGFDCYYRINLMGVFSLKFLLERKKHNWPLNRISLRWACMPFWSNVFNSIKLLELGGHKWVLVVVYSMES